MNHRIRLSKRDAEIYYRRVPYLHAITARTVDRIDYGVMAYHTRLRMRLGATPAQRVTSQFKPRPMLAVVDHQPRVVNFT